MKTAVILGRFQNFKLHDGYLAMLQYAYENYDKIVIILGKSYRKNTFENPLDVETRKRLIRTRLTPSINTKLDTILFIRDAKTDVAWCANLDTLVEGVVENLNFDFLVGRDSFEPHYVGKYKGKFVNVPEVPETSSTKDRATVSMEQVSDINTFAKGMIYASRQPYPRVDVTVDCAVIIPQYRAFQIVLGRKPNETGYRLPGGYIDAQDATFRDAASRELQEEANIFVSKRDWQYVESLNVNDWRYRGSRDTSRTSLFYTEKEIGDLLPEMKAGDDLCEVKLAQVSITDATNYECSLILEKEHKILLDLVVIHYVNNNKALF